jgi:site-specific DNA-methyltransferase (adenine-specific)
METFGKITLHNGDCMDVLKSLPDNAFDLAIVDPPYGLGIDGQKESICKNPKHNRKQHERKDWDKNTPPMNILLSLKGLQRIKSFGVQIILLKI